MEDIALKLAEIRKDKAISQQKMADLLNIPQKTWANYETGRSNPSLKVLMKLAEMGYAIPGLTAGLVADLHLLNVEAEERNITQKDFSLFKFSHGRTTPVTADETDVNSVVFLPIFGQPVSAGPGQSENQLSEIDAYLPVLYEMLAGANPKNCGVVRVVGDSMTDINLFNGDVAIFDRTQLEGNGVYVISVGGEMRVKHLEYRLFDKKVIISSENAKRYTTPEVLNYEQAENLLRVHGKVLCWVHKHPY